MSVGWEPDTARESHVQTHECYLCPDYAGLGLYTLDFRIQTDPALYPFRKRNSLNSFHGHCGHNTLKDRVR